MRHLCLGILAASLCLATLPESSSAQDIRVSGSLNADAPIEVGFLRVMVEAAASQTEFLTGEADDFAFSIPATEPVLALVAAGSERFQPFWLEPGADIRLERVGDGDNARLKVSGVGSEGPAFILSGGYEEPWKERLGALSAAAQQGPDEVSFEDYVSRVDRAAREMDALVRAAGLSELYEQILLVDNVARVNRARAWALDSLEPTEAEAESLEASATQDLLRQGEIPGAAYAIRYIEALGDLLDETYYETVQSIGGVTSPSGFYHFRRSVKATPALRDALVSEVMYSMLRSQDYTREIAELVEDFARTASTEDARTFIESTAALRQQLAPGAPAPALVATRRDGGTLDLTELHGRTVLLTVWGSWCPWSRGEMPYLEGLRQRMAETDPDIVFLNVGWDLEGPWREAIEEFGLGGTHVLSTEELRAAWSITGTPDFIVVAPDGTIVTSNAPRPSEDGGEALAEILRATAR
jgi:thiol-disulfide isomerase/thioredoxin